MDASTGSGLQGEWPSRLLAYSKVESPWREVNTLAPRDATQVLVVQKGSFTAAIGPRQKHVTLGAGSVLMVAWGVRVSLRAMSPRGSRYYHFVVRGETGRMPNFRATCLPLGATSIQQYELERGGVLVHRSRLFPGNFRGDLGVRWFTIRNGTEHTPIRVARPTVVLRHLGQMSFSDQGELGQSRTQQLRADGWCFRPGEIIRPAALDIPGQFPRVLSATGIIITL